jgi:hypothetical protein
MDKLNYFKKDDRNNFMSSYSNKSEYGNNDYQIHPEDHIGGLYKTTTSKLDKKPEPENNLEMNIPVR